MERYGTISARGVDGCRVQVSGYDPIGNILDLASGGKVDLGPVVSGSRRVSVRPDDSPRQQMPGDGGKRSRNGFSFVRTRAVTGAVGGQVTLWAKQAGGYELTTKTEASSDRRLTGLPGSATDLFVGPALHGDLRWLAIVRDAGKQGIAIDLLEWRSASTFKADR